MSQLRTFARDRRVWLVVLLGIFTLVVSRYALPADPGVKFVIYTGYWVLLAVFAFFAYTLARPARDAWRNLRLGRPEAAIAAVILASGSMLLVHEKYGYKILADEVLLAGTSMGMHYERHVAYPFRATDVQGPFQILQSVIDKRPFFFPFLTSLVHDFTGYRPENGFYLNTALGFVFLLLVYLVGRKVGASAWPGILLVVLFAGLPLLSQQMKGGGFELLNLVMLAVVLLLGIRFAEKRDEAALESFAYAAVLLAYTRYESIVMLVPVAGLVVWAWWRENRVILTWPVVVAPLLVSLPILQNRVFTLNTGAWELGSKPTAGSPFSVSYFADNFGHAMGFFFDTTGYQPNSPLFSAVGLLAIAFFLLWLVRTFRTLPASSATNVGTAFVGAGLVGIFLLLMLYFWGQFDDPVIHRLSLPVHLLMAVAIVAVGGSIIRSERVWKLACAAAVVSLIVYSLPVMTRRAYGASYSPAAEMEWRAEFMRRFPSHDYLFLDNDSVFWIIHHIPATPNTQAKEREDGLFHLLQNDSFSAMYVMQHFRVDPGNGQRKIVPADEIGPDFELEPVWERRISAVLIGRISRIKSIHFSGKVAHAGLIVSPNPTPVLNTKSDEDWDKAKKAYVDKWLKELP